MNKVGLQLPISVLRLGRKPLKALGRLGVYTIGDFLLFDVSQVTLLDGVGQGTVKILAKTQEEVLHLTDNSSGNLDGIVSDYPELWRLLKSLLSVRTRNGLDALSIKSLNEFMNLDRDTFLSARSIGETSWKEVKHLQKRLAQIELPVLDKHSLSKPSNNDQLLPFDDKAALEIVRKSLRSRAHLLDDLNITEFIQLKAITQDDVFAIPGAGDMAWEKLQSAILLAESTFIRVMREETYSTLEDFPLWNNPSIINIDIPKNTSQQYSINYNQLISHDDVETLERVRKLLGSISHILDDLNISTITQLKAVTIDDVLHIPGSCKETWAKLHNAIILAESTIILDACKEFYSTPEDISLCKNPSKPNIDIPDIFFPDHSITEIVSSKRCIDTLNHLNLKTIGDALQTSPNVFLKMPNFGMSSLELLRSDIRKFIEYQSKEYLNELYANSFSDYLFALCKNADIVDDHALIVVERLTGNDNKPCTLDNIATQFGCTRERVRQIIKTTFEKINNSYRNRQSLQHLRILLKDLVSNSGGIVNLDEVMSYISEAMNWREVVNSSTFIECLKHISLGHGIKLNKQLLFMQYPCRNCEALSTMFKQMIENEFNGQISFIQLGKHASHLCLLKNEKGCPQEPHNFSREFWCEHANRLGLTFDAENIYTNKMWQLHNGGLPRKVEAILHAAQSTMKPDEVTHILNKELREEYSTKKVHAALIISPECVVWGRGEFIHSSRIICSDEIIDYIAVILANKLSAVPFIASKGIYDEFRTTFMRNGIPNEYALSSVIKLHLERFHVDKYRYIYPEKPENSTSIDDHIEKWVLDAGEAVKRCDLENWLIDEIGTRESLVNLALNRIDSIIPEKKGWLVHIDNLGINKSNLMPLCEYIDKELDRFTQLGVNKILKSNQVYLAHLKIHNARMLYAILQYLCSDKYNFPRFPHIGLLGQDNSMSLSQELSNYVHKRKRVVTVEECVEYFEKKGYSAVQTRARIGGLSQLLEYYPRCIVHENSLGWNSEKIHILKDIMIDSYNVRISSGYLSGDLDEVFEIYEEQLPSLNNGISWTGRLLASVSGQIEEVILLGNAKRAYLLNGYSSCPFANLGDLVCHVVRNHFSGGCSRADLNQWMVDNGIVKKQLTSQMFTPPKGLVLTEYECYWEGK